MNPFLEQIKQYAMKQAGMTEEDLKTAHRHHSECVCMPCLKFSMYLPIKERLEDWENYKIKVTILKEQK